ncbi:MAG: DUF5683 domain-containing protein [Lentimicrobiaceae bacterium]|nr:DUF5683 domain-containing protein [Lentimicrobiaceae bacterium]
MKSYLFLVFFIAISVCCWGQDEVFLLKDSLPQDSMPALLADSVPAVLQDSMSDLPMDTSAVKEKKHSPKLAGGLSAALPGLGQAYNKKYWKIPIVYAGFAATGYCVYYFHGEYVKYRDEYRNRLNGKPPQFDLPDANIILLRQSYQKDMQLSILFTTLWYVANILDAVVDAHLMTYDISSDLSMHIAPDVNGGFGFGNATKNHAIGLSFTLNF